MEKSENNHSRLTEHLADFYQYLSGGNGVNSHTKTNYISWLKFLDKQGYPLTDIESFDDIEDILTIDQTQQQNSNRAKYTSAKDIVNFRSALRKFLQFLKSDYTHKQEETILAEISHVQNDVSLSQTERDEIVKARIGQGLFRNKLIDYWHGCSISAYAHFDMLVASHIKPWKDADNSERINVYNGLLLLPNYDKLFDRGYISFEDNGHIIYSSYIDNNDKRLLGMDNSLHLTKIEVYHIPFLRYHRENCLMR